jgi:hypothetical protein
VPLSAVVFLNTLCKSYLVEQAEVLVSVAAVRLDDTHICSGISP